MLNNKIKDFFKKEMFVKPAEKVSNSSEETAKSSNVASKMGAIKDAVAGSKVVSVAAETGSKVASVVVEKGEKVVSVVSETGAKVAAVVAETGEKVVSAVTETGAKIGNKLPKGKKKEEVLTEFEQLTETENETNNVFELAMESMINICEKNNITEAELEEILTNFKENISEEEINKIKTSKKREKVTEKMIVKYIGTVTAKRETKKERKVIVK